MASPPGPFATAIALRDAIGRRDLSARDACQIALDRIAAQNGALHAFQHVDADRALARADALDRSGSSAGPLHGVPVALKDNIALAGMVTTAGSRILERYVSPFDATAAARLERAGAVIVGKTVCDEFAMGSSTENSAFGPARNPWALDRIPGGSSGGSAAAVAAGLTPIALGSDTGGSIRQPAALCGIVGIKPTYGRVSRHGLLALASSLDQIGPMTRTVADAALVLEVISGADPRDATSADREVPKFSSALDGDVRGLRVGVPSHLLDAGVDADVRQAFESAVETLARLGARVTVRRRALRRPRRGRLGRRDVRPHAARRLRRRSQTPDYARDVRPQRGLLRGVLFESAAGAHAHPAGLRPRLRVGGRRRAADHAHAGVPIG
jgi:aspartyl-tRNA(Asn)/glutamyl-tRNA(Gln) amidotransferase subunit A